MAIPERYMVTAKRLDDGETVTGYYENFYIRDTDKYVDTVCGKDIDVGKSFVLVDPDTVEPVAVKAVYEEDSDLGLCPNCGDVAEIFEHIGDDKGEWVQFDYCPYCGQRIDRSE